MCENSVFSKIALQLNYEARRWKIVNEEKGKQYKIQNKKETIECTIVCMTPHAARVHYEVSSRE